MIPPTPSSLRFLVALVILVGLRASAGVIVIDPDATRPAVPAIAAPSASVRISVTALRFLPAGKSAAFKGKLSPTASLAETVAALGKEGQVNLLYLGTRDLRWDTNEVAQFNSLDRRPAFSLNEAGNQSLTNIQFGMTLRIRARPEPNNSIALRWEGSFAWSSQLIDMWAGDKYLMFGMRVAKLLKPGLLYTESDDDEDSGAGKGINIGGLFKKKAKAEKKDAAPPVLDLSYLDKDRHVLPMTGQRSVAPDELMILNFPSPEADSREIIYLLLQATYE